MRDQNETVSMYAHWHSPKQRPHHLVDALNKRRKGVGIYCLKSASAKEWVPVRSPNRLHAYRTLPSRWHDVKVVSVFNRYQNERAVQAFVNSRAADIHIYAVMPKVLPKKNPPVLIYDCNEDWSNFSLSGYSSENERTLCGMADRIWVTSRALQEKIVKEYGHAAEYVPNGVDYNHFAQARGFKNVSRNSRPILGYVGVLEWWFDTRLVSDVAHLLPEWDVLLVGPMGLDPIQRKILDVPNIKIMGTQPYELLPQVLARFDVAMVPFLLNDLTRAVNPIKLYEYFAAGLPVVATRLPELQSFIEPGVLACCDNGESFAKAVGEIGETRAAERRQEIAAANTWDLRFSRALASIPGMP